ncbi:hypothetical protein GF342_05400 [Candidatus Woesearchaeota archaeon]|nr:hypothetical protein [Candidatus Woesearchaeota archaeon]
MVKTRNLYGVPVDMKKVSFVISHPKAHLGPFSEAIDFICPEGTSLIAAFE